MSERGTVTDEFCTKVIQGLKQDTEVTNTISPDVIRLLWTYYGAFPNDIMARTIFTHWEGELPANALRLHITVEQTLNTGLTTLVVTGGLTEHPMFPWSRLIKLAPYSSEMTALKLAMETVGDNHYYGFRKDLAVVKSTLYKNLSYVAKELLVKVDGETALSRYAGFPKSPAQKPIVSSMIDAYINQLAQYGIDPDKSTLPSEMGVVPKAEAKVESSRIRIIFWKEDPC